MSTSTAPPNIKPQTRCCCCSSMLIAMAAMVMWVVAYFEHVPFMNVLETASSHVYQFTQQEIASRAKRSPVSPATVPVNLPTSAPLSAVPVSTPTPGSDLQPPPSNQTQPAVYVPTGANYLQPFDSTIQPGDARLDGLVTSVNGDEIKMKVLWVTLPGQRRTVFAAPRNKTIFTFDSTQMTLQHSPTRTPFENFDASSPEHIMVIGPATSAGQPVSARSVDVEPANALENALCDAMQNAADTIALSHHPAPVVTLEHANVNVGSGSETVEYVKAKGGTFKIEVGLGGGKVGSTESLSAIANRYGAIAAINGSFFDCYAPGPVKMPDHALISDGRLVARGGVGTMIGQTPDGQIQFGRDYDTSRWHEFDPEQLNPKILNDPQDSVVYWGRATEGLGCGPRLVSSGAVSLSPQVEGFSSAEVLTGVSVRSAVGVTSDGSLILVVTHANLPQLAQIMVQLGCKNAMNLDGGASSGLWIKGKSLRTPGRLLSNALVVVGR